MEMKFLFPIDGDVLTPDDGAVEQDPLYGDRIHFVARIAADTGLRVTLNEREAREVEPGIYEADGYTDGVRTTLDAYAFQSDSPAGHAVIRIFRFKEAYRKYRLAIDDIVWSMEALAKNADTMKSIFEVPFFGLFRDLHSEFGTKTHMNIYFRNADATFTLKQVPDKFKEEFIANSDWFKFTFHARANDPAHIYQRAPYSELLHDYHQVTNEILRFAGPEVNTDVNGLHYAETTLEGARALRSVGIRVLLGYYKFDADGNPSIAFYLDKPQTAHAAVRDFWVDTKEDIVFSKDKMVIDQYALEDIVPRLDFLKNERPHESGTMNFVTHKQYYYPHYSHYQPQYRDKIFTCARWATENGYTPCFLDDVLC